MLALVGGAATLREGALGYAAMALGLALAAAFFFLQRRVPQPLLNVEFLSRNRLLANALLVQWLLYCNAFGTVFLLSLHMQSILGRAANTAGQVIAFGSLLMAAIAPAVGRLTDRWRPAPVASLGIAIALASALLGTQLGASSGLVAVGLVIAVQGIGFAFFSTPNMAMIMNAVPRERTGIASALSATARGLGMVSGMLIVAALVSVNLGHDPVGADPARFVATLQASFWVLVGTTAAALALALRR
jgi:MFS family permease